MSGNFLALGRVWREIFRPALGKMLEVTQRLGEGADRIVYHPKIGGAVDAAEASGALPILAAVVPTTPTREFPALPFTAHFGAWLKPLDLGAPPTRATRLQAAHGSLAAGGARPGQGAALPAARRVLRTVGAAALRRLPGGAAPPRRLGRRSAHDGLLVPRRGRRVGAGSRAGDLSLRGGAAGLRGLRLHDDAAPGPARGGCRRGSEARRGAGARGDGLGRARARRPGCAGERARPSRRAPRCALPARARGGPSRWSGNHRGGAARGSADARLPRLRRPALLGEPRPESRLRSRAAPPASKLRSERFAAALEDLAETDSYRERAQSIARAIAEEDGLARAIEVIEAG